MIDKIGHYSLQNHSTVYDEEALTVLELASRTAGKVNECVDTINDTVESLPGMIDEGVQHHIDNGTFDRKIDVHQQEILEEVEENRLAMQNQLGNKLDKDNTGQVTMQMLAQEVKEAMTGGSVAVVGQNAVGTPNLMNGSVTGEKMKPNTLNCHSFMSDYDTPVLIVDSENMDLVFGRSDDVVIITPTEFFTVTLSKATIDYSRWDNPSLMMLWYEKSTNTFHVTNALNFFYDWYLIGYIYSTNSYEVIIPVEWNGTLYTPNKKTERKISNLVCRTYYADNTKVIPYIDFENEELVIPGQTGVYGQNGYLFKHLATSATLDPIRIPFVEGSDTMYLVGNVDTLEFINANVYNGGGTSNKYMFTFGFVDVKNRTTSLNFECARHRSLSILGDSISTYQGYNPPGNAVYYNGVSGDVTHPFVTWWWRVMNRCGMSLNVNNSYSGGRVSGTATSGALARCESLDNGTDPDVIAIFMGINDFNGNVPLGDYDGKTPPTNPGTFREAYAMMLKNILSQYKTSKVYAMTLPACQHTDEEIEWPEINGAGVGLWEYNQAIRDVAAMFHVEIIDTASCQINNYNGEVNFTDYNDDGGFLHPNKAGFKKIADKVIAAILHGAE